MADGTYAYGGACYSDVSGSLTVDTCWFAANQAVGNASSGSGYGGAIYLGGNAGALFAVRNSTLSANEAKGSQALGGGICLEIQIPLSLVNSTLSGNSAVRTGGIPPSAFARGGAFYSLCSGTPIDPLIGILFNNGGPTPTRALLPGSPAINAANSAAAPATDQRGFARSGDADIGAYELQTGLPLSITCPPPLTRSAAIFPNPPVATLTHADLGTSTIPCSCQESLVVEFVSGPDGSLSDGDPLPSPYAFPIGTTTVRWEATDTNPDPDETVSCTQTITVNAGANSNPVFVSGPALPFQGYKDHLFTAPAVFVFTDPDPGQVVTYTATGLPPGVGIDLNTGLISGTPTAVGTFNVIVTATDNFPGTPGTASTASFQFKVDDFVTLTVNPSPANGKITAPATVLSPALDCGTGGAVCSQDYPLNAPPTKVTLTAMPQTGYELDSWTGATMQLNRREAEVTMDGNKTVTANFVLLRTLNLTVSGSPGIVSALPAPNSGPPSWDNNGKCSETYTPQFRDGQSITLTAVQQAGANWAGWTLDGGAVDMNLTLIVNMTANHSVTATFTPTAPRIQFGALPATTPVLAGDPVNRGFTVTTPGLVGGTVTYNWYKMGGAGPISGQTTPTLSIIPTSTTYEGQYYLRVVNQCGETADSPLWTLTLARDFGDAPYSPPATQFPTAVPHPARQQWRAAHSLGFGPRKPSPTGRCRRC